MHVRDITEDDIPYIMDYWFNPANQAFHQKRGPFSDEQKALLVSQPEKLRAQIAIPEQDRNHTTAILEIGGKPVGHVLLNDIRDDHARRVHFHLWRNAATVRGFNHASKIWADAIAASATYFFSRYDMKEIVGDVSVENKIANRLLDRMGYKPVSMIRASYLGYEADYNRYIIKNGA